MLCVLHPGVVDDADLRGSIAKRIADELGKPLKPEVVTVVRTLPKTRSGKVMRRVIRAAWLDLEPGRPQRARRPGRSRGHPHVCPAGRVGTGVEVRAGCHGDIRTSRSRLGSDGRAHALGSHDRRRAVSFPR